MNRIYIILLLFIVSISATAQSEKASLINDIKKENNLYLYGDVTLSTLEVAYEVALQELQTNLAEWASNHSRKAVERTQITNLSTLADTIVMKRYNMYRVFAYVHKAKIMEVLNKNGFKIHDNLVTKEDPYNKNKLTHKPDIAQRVAPTPKKAETLPPPKKDTEVVTAPPAKTPQPADTLKTKHSSIGIQDLFPDKLRKDLKKEQPPKDKPVPADAKQKKWQEDITKSPFVMPKKEKEKSPLPVPYLKELEKILSAKDFFDLEGIMTPMKKSGVITEMGRYTSGMDVSDCYLVVFDTDGNICALLSPGKDTRMNIGTKTPDHTSNYKNCGAIWFKMK